MSWSSYNEKKGLAPLSRFQYDGVCDAIAEALFLVRGPNEECAEQIGDYEWDQIKKPQDRSDCNFGIVDRRAICFSYDFDLDGHFPDSLSVVAFEQREVKECDDDVDQDERAKERAD